MNWIRVKIYILSGVLCVMPALGCWLACLRAVPVAGVAPVWYLSPVLGLVWAKWPSGGGTLWFALGSAALVLMGVWLSAGGRRRDLAGDL